jgi:hypothetical protein
MLKTNGRGRLVTSSATKTKNKAEMLKAESRNGSGQTRISRIFTNLEGKAEN